MIQMWEVSRYFIGNHHTARETRALQDDIHNKLRSIAGVTHLIHRHIIGNHHTARETRALQDAIHKIIVFFLEGARLARRAA